MNPALKKDLFLRLSSALTGVAIDSFIPGPGETVLAPAKPGDLNPKNTQIGLADEFIETIENKISAGKFIRLLQAFDTIAHDIGSDTADFQAVKTILEVGHRQDYQRDFADICRNIIKLWYVGIWYTLDDSENDSPCDPVTGEVVSSQAYKEGLVWKIMQAHPTGYSVMPFGHWADDPPELEHYITINDEA